MNWQSRYKNTTTQENPNYKQSLKHLPGTKMNNDNPRGQREEEERGSETKARKHEA